jgi:hypothetical protein
MFPKSSDLVGVRMIAKTISAFLVLFCVAPVFGRAPVDSENDTIVSMGLAQTYLNQDIGSKTWLSQFALSFYDLNRQVHIQGGLGYPDDRLDVSVAAHYLPFLQWRKLFYHAGMGAGFHTFDNSGSFTEEAHFFVEPLTSLRFKFYSQWGIILKLSTQWVWWKSVSTPGDEPGNDFFTNRFYGSGGIFLSWNY